MRTCQGQTSAPVFHEAVSVVSQCRVLPAEASNSVYACVDETPAPSDSAQLGCYCCESARSRVIFHLSTHHNAGGLRHGSLRWVRNGITEADTSIPSGPLMK